MHWFCLHTLKHDSVRQVGWTTARAGRCAQLVKLRRPLLPILHACCVPSASPPAQVPGAFPNPPASSKYCPYTPESIIPSWMILLLFCCFAFLWQTVSRTNPGLP